jgi:ankyrin repeat protein
VELLNLGAKVDAHAWPQGWTPLMYAAASPRADVPLLETLIEAGAAPNAVSLELEETPLTLAAKAGNLAKLQHLVRAGADIRFRNSKGYTVMMAAAPYPVPEVVRYLIEAGADLDSVSDWKESALSMASHHGYYDTVQQLLEAGADPKPLEWTSLMKAVALGSPRELTGLLRSRAGLVERDRWSRTPWLIGLVAGSVDKCRLLLAAGAESLPGITLSIYSGQPQIVTWLIEQGADLNTMDELASTALMAASHRGHAACVRALIEAGADVRAENQFMMQAIQEAANAEVASLLVNAGAEIDTIDGTGRWLLRNAAEDGNLAFVQALLKMGARADTNSIGETALHSATWNDHLGVMRVLLDAGADPNAADVDRWTPLNRAWSVEGARLLLEAGADPSRASRLPTLFQDHDPDMVALFAPGSKRARR